MSTAQMLRPSASPTPSRADFRQRRTRRTFPPHSTILTKDQRFRRSVPPSHQLPPGPTSNKQRATRTFPSRPTILRNDQRFRCSVHRPHQLPPGPPPTHRKKERNQIGGQSKPTRLPIHLLSPLNLTIALLSLSPPFRSPNNDAEARRFPSVSRAHRHSPPSTEKMSSPSPSPPKYYWGDMPEAEFYASQGVKNHQSYYLAKTNVNIFTQRFEPIDTPIKGTVYMTHGYASDSGWMFQKIAIAFARWGYVVFCADLYGHGRSDGIRCYLGDMEMVAATSLSFFAHTRQLPAYSSLPAFLFGESMGGLATLLMYFQSPPDLWTGLIFSAPLFVIPEEMKPSRLRLFLFGLLLGLADTWQMMPDNRMVGKAIKDKELLKIIAANPRRYTGRPRVGTMRELARMTEYVQGRFKDVTAPFLTVHGTEDGVTSPTSSVLLHERAASRDKELKLHDGMYHSLIQGEPDVNSQRVLAGMRAWIDERVRRYGGGADTDAAATYPHKEG